MKTEGTGDILWNGNVDLQLTHEECLPEIGTSHITSLLTTITTQNDKSLENNDPSSQNLNLVTLEANNKEKSDTQMSNMHTLNTVIIFEDIANTNKEKSPNGKMKKMKDNEENYEDMLYFVCNLCPFLCTKATKITEHLETLHKTTSATKPLTLKCPACTNTFFHKISLRSHLVHDHQVGNTDLKKILQAVIYYAKKNSNNPENKKNNINQKTTNTLQQFNTGLDLDNSEQTVNIENIVSQENNNSTSNDTLTSPSLEHSSIIEDKSIHGNLHFLSKAQITNKDSQITSISTVPALSFQQQSPDKVILNTIIKTQTSSSKCLEQGIFHKCEMSMCKIRLRDSAKMFYHMKCHIENGFKCLECGQTFSYWKPLTGHLWRSHKIDMELYACDKCDYKTFSLGKLNNIHRLIHSEAKPFICDICSKGFKNSKQLRNHKIKHKEYPNKVVQLCVECNKTFSDKRQLRIHMDSVHKKLKPFLCNYCGYKGASKSSLRMHIRQHTGEKPFSCNSCSYTTADHNSLRRHKLRHTGQKPYKCLYCDYACIQSSTFKIHLKTKHPGLEKNLMFACSECQFRTVNKDMYLTHVSTVHNKTIRICL